jgi:vanadium chloroperoxidase
MSLPRRKVDETLIGVYWAYDGASGLGTPPRLYNQIIREIAIAKGNSVQWLGQNQAAIAP